MSYFNKPVTTVSHRFMLACIVDWACLCSNRPANPLDDKMYLYNITDVYMTMSASARKDILGTYMMGGEL